MGRVSRRSKVSSRVDWFGAGRGTSSLGHAQCSASLLLFSDATETLGTGFLVLIHLLALATCAILGFSATAERGGIGVRTTLYRIFAAYTPTPRFCSEMEASQWELMGGVWRLLFLSLIVYCVMEVVTLSARENVIMCWRCLDTAQSILIIFNAVSTY